MCSPTGTAATTRSLPWALLGGDAGQVDAPESPAGHALSLWHMPLQESGSWGYPEHQLEEAAPWQPALLVEMGGRAQFTRLPNAPPDVDVSPCCMRGPALISVSETAHAQSFVCCELELPSNVFVCGWVCVFL